MLNRVLRALVSKREQARVQAERDAAGAADAVAFLGPSIRSMTEISPPKAANDDPMAPVFEEVERELKRAGYLR